MKRVKEIKLNIWDCNKIFNRYEKNVEQNKSEFGLKPPIMSANYEQMLSGVDCEIRHLVDVLNRNGYTTVASCGGHGYLPGNIALKDGRELFIIETYAKARLVTKLLIKEGLYSPPLQNNNK
jgi:hypothetical protein